MWCMELLSFPWTNTICLLMMKLKSRFYTHNRSFTVRDPDIQTSLSNHIWELKDQNIQFSVTWQVLEKSKSFNPISLQCLLCLSEATQILVNPNLATLNSRSKTYGFCSHRKKYVKPLTFRYKG